MQNWSRINVDNIILVDIAILIAVPIEPDWLCFSPPQSGPKKKGQWSGLPNQTSFVFVTKH